MDEAGIKFLDKLYQNLYMSDVVQHTKEPKDSRVEAIKKYLERLERIHSKADTEEKKRHILFLYYKKFIIDEKNIPYGADATQIIGAQRESLKRWIDYLSTKDAMYPIWAKYWAFMGMLKMGSYDEAKGVYLTRNKKTVAPFVEPNPELIAKCIDVIQKIVKGEEIPDETEEVINKNDSFSKIYTIFEKQLKKNIVGNISDSTEGIWIKYNQGNMDDAKKLCDSLQNKNTGWCTATQGMAQRQVSDGDFYVYYTKDQDGGFTIPRIALRMNGQTQIGEIRGILEGQNLEESMTGILESKLKSMKFLSDLDINLSMKNIDKMKKISYIYKKAENKEELTSEEIQFIYSRETVTFGWDTDPRIIKIIEKRDAVSDFRKLQDDKTRKEFIEGLPFKSITNIDFLLEAIKYSPSAFDKTDRILRDKILTNKKLFMQVVYLAPQIITFCSKRFRDSHPGLLIGCVKKNEFLFEYLSSELMLSHPEVVVDACSKHPYNIKSLPHNYLETHSDIVKKLLALDICIMNYLPKNVIIEHADFIMTLLSKNSSYITFPFSSLPLETIINHPNEVKKIAKKNWHALADIPIEFQLQHPNIMMDLLLHSMGYYRLQYVSKEFAIKYPTIMAMAFLKIPNFLFDSISKRITERLISNDEDKKLINKEDYDRIMQDVEKLKETMVGKTRGGEEFDIDALVKKVKRETILAMEWKYKFKFAFRTFKETYLGKKGYATGRVK